MEENFAEGVKGDWERDSMGAAIYQIDIFVIPLNLIGK
jgi:hypothetical protein